MTVTDLPVAAASRSGSEQAANDRAPRAPGDRGDATPRGCSACSIRDSFPGAAAPRRRPSPPWPPIIVIVRDQGPGPGVRRPPWPRAGAVDDADDELGRSSVRSGDRRPAIRSRAPSRRQPEVVGRQADGGERRVEECRERDVVEADDRDVVGDAQARLAHRRDGPEGDDVAGDEDGRRSGRAGAARPSRGGRSPASKAASATSSVVERRCRPPRARPGSRRAVPGRRCRRAGAFVMQAIRRWPSPIRCSTARRAPLTLSMSTLGDVEARQRALEDDREAVAGELGRGRRRRRAARRRRGRRRAGPGAGRRTSRRPGRAARPSPGSRPTGPRRRGRAASRPGRRRRRPARPTGAGRSRAMWLLPPARRGPGRGGGSRARAAASEDALAGRRADVDVRPVVQDEGHGRPRDARPGRHIRTRRSSS